MNWEKIFELKSKGENERVEFKTSPFLKDNDEIAAQITSFANRYGGKILIGLRDEEALQEWNAIEGAKIDRDKTLLHILNIAENNCSPPVKFSSDFLESEKGDILILNIERREDIPHAVVARTHNEIKKRIYYIRTVNGKRLVNNRLLAYMFKNLEDPYLESQFVIGFQYTRDNLYTSGSMFDIPYYCIHNIAPFIQQLKENDIKFIKKEEINRIQVLFVELLPYAMLDFLSRYFRSSWKVEIEKLGAFTTISPLKEVDKTELKLEDILNPPETSLLSNLSLDIKSILSRRFSKLTLPPGTKFKITHSPETPPTSIIKLTRENSFEFNLSFCTDSWMSGAGELTPLYGILNTVEERMKLEELFAGIFIKTNLSCQFSFPDIDDPFFDEIYQWSRLIIDLIKENWDWNMIISNLPERKLFTIENYLKKILKIIEK